MPPHIPREEKDKSIEESGHPENNHNNSPPVLPFDWGKPLSVGNKSNPNKTICYKLKRLRPIVEILTLIAVLFYASVAYFQLCSMKDATRKTVAEMIYQRRPWIADGDAYITPTGTGDKWRYGKADSIINLGHIFDDLHPAKKEINNKGLTVVLGFKNYGNSPAIDIHISSHWCLESPPTNPNDNTDAAQESFDHCGTLERNQFFPVKPNQEDRYFGALVQNAGVRTERTFTTDDIKKVKTSLNKGKNLIVVSIASYKYAGHEYRQMTWMKYEPHGSSDEFPMKLFARTRIEAKGKDGKWQKDQGIPDAN